MEDTARNEINNTTRHVGSYSQGNTRWCGDMLNTKDSRIATLAPQSNGSLMKGGIEIDPVSLKVYDL